MCWVTRECKKGFGRLHRFIKKHIVYVTLMPFIVLITSVWINGKVLRQVAEINNNTSFNTRVELIDTILSSDHHDIADIQDFVIHENSLDNQVMRLYDDKLIPLTPTPDDSATLANIMRIDQNELYRTMQAKYDRVFFNKRTVGVDVLGYQHKFFKDGKDYHLVFMTVSKPVDEHIVTLYKDVDYILSLNAIISFVLNVSLICAFLYYEKARKAWEK